MKSTDILKLIPSVLVTVGIIMLWYDDFIAVLIMSLGFYITIPALIAAIVIFFLSIKMNTVGKKVIVFYGIFNILLLAAYILFVSPHRQCSPEIMEKHYEKHAAELDELCRFAFEALDDSCAVTLEWEHGKLDMFHVESHGECDNCCNEEAIVKQDSLMQIVGLTKEELDGIRKRLKKAGCIGIEVSSTTPHNVAVWFRRVGMGRYDYMIKDTALTEEEKAEVMDSSGDLIPYNERVVFRYGGGAIGPQVFGKEEREEYMSKHKAW